MKNSKEKSFFKVRESGSTYTKEILAGIVIFLAMVYILPLNVGILSDANGSGMNPESVFIATAIASAIACLAMGLIAKFPVALSAGMGLNAYFSYTVCATLNYTWGEALTITLVASIIFVIITVTPIRRKIIEAIPLDLRNAIIVGLGTFIAFVGFKNSGIIMDSPSTLVTLGKLDDPSVLLAIFGVMLVFIISNLKSKISTFAIPLAMAITAIVGLILGGCGIPNMPTFSGESSNFASLGETFGQAFFHFDVLLDPKTYAVIFSFIFVNLFDTTGTMLAVGSGAGFINERGELVGANKALLVDAGGAVVSGILGTSPVTSFVESNVGVEMGGRTGLTAVVTGILFLLSIFAYPIFSIFSHSSVTAMALIAVGSMMFADLKNINWNDKIIVATTFLIVILMILCYSISDGLGIGIIFYCLMMSASKRGKEVNKVIYIIALFYVLSYVLNIILL